MAHLSAGTTFKINETVIEKCLSTPDLGAEPERVDVTTLDDLTNKAYIKGLQDISSLNLDFIQETDNFIAAQKDEAKSDNNYNITFPSGISGTFKGEHAVFPLATSPGQPEKFRISISISDKIVFSTSSAGV